MQSHPILDPLSLCVFASSARELDGQAIWQLPAGGER